LISCMNFNAMPCIAPLERDLQKPVLASHSATFWKVLRMIRVRDPVPGYGRLLDEGLSLP
jgi:maleate cis-trans isomerase